MTLKDTPWKENYDQPRQHIKKQRHYFDNKGPSSQGYGFSSGHVWMWELDYKESWAQENWCFWTVVLEKTLESPLDCNEIQPVHPKGDQSWVFVGRTDAEAETPILWPPDVKSWLIGKDPDAGEDWGREKKGTTEDEMVGCHHWPNGPRFGLNSRSWWCTRRPGVLQFMGSQWVGHDWANELNWTDRYNLSDMRWGSRLSLQGSIVSRVELVLIWKQSFFRACAQSSGMNRLWIWWKKRSGERVKISSVQFSSVAQSYSTLHHRMNHSTPGLPVHHLLPEFTQTHVHRVGDAIQ